MSKETQMLRSTFSDIRGQQQIDKYKALNTYNVFINDSQGIGYEDGVSEHNSFKIIFPDNQSGHIKNAKVRVRCVGLGTDEEDIETSSGFRIETNILKNAFNSQGRYGGHLGCFKITDRLFPTTTASLAGRATNVGGALGAAVVNDVATKFNNTTFLPCNNPVGIPVSDDYYYCNNPFGKEVRFDLVEIAAENFIDLGTGAGENTYIELEVILLPDSQANDKFSY